MIDLCWSTQAHATTSCCSVLWIGCRLSGSTTKYPASTRLLRFLMCGTRLCSSSTRSLARAYSFSANWHPRGARFIPWDVPLDVSMQRLREVYVDGFDKPD